jgi:predicted DNA-binding transcriptional regulator AlpA
MTYQNQTVHNDEDIIFIEELSRVIGKAVTTIRTNTTCKRYMHLIPRPVKLPNSRRLAWRWTSVRQWLEAAQPVGPRT